MKYSFLGMGACGLVACWVTYLEMNHEHHHAPDRVYKNVRKGAIVKGFSLYLSSSVSSFVFAEI